MDLKFWERIKNVYVEGIAVDSLTLLLSCQLTHWKLGIMLFVAVSSEQKQEIALPP